MSTDFLGRSKLLSLVFIGRGHVGVT